MKRIETKDLKPGFYWLRDKNDHSLDPVRVYEAYGGKLYYLLTGNECEASVEGEEFFELITPVENEIVLYQAEYDGESIVDMERDLSESLDGDFNPNVHLIPKMEDHPDFWAGRFVVNLTWLPDEEDE